MKENWPFDTTCTKQKTIYEKCYEDIECQNHQFCWYPSREFRETNPTKVCLDMYSQDIGETFGWEAPDEPQPEDFIKNGQYCVSGLAYPISKYEARCASFKEMRFKDKVIEEPFKCNPTDPKVKCKLYIQISEDDKDNSYSSTRDFVQNDCKCALDGEKDSGYCSLIVGTEWYEKGVAAHQHMMSSSKCHTMDRYNLRA